MKRKQNEPLLEARLMADQNHQRVRAMAIPMHRRCSHIAVGVRVIASFTGRKTAMLTPLVLCSSGTRAQLKPKKRDTR